MLDNNFYNVVLVSTYKKVVKRVRDIVGFGLLIIGGLLVKCSYKLLKNSSYIRQNHEDILEYMTDDYRKPYIDETIDAPIKDSNEYEVMHQYQ